MSEEVGVDRVPRKPFPLDPEELERGDFIAPKRIESIYGVDREEEGYRFKMMELREFIERNWVDGDGFGVAVKAEGFGLRLLMPEEVASYSAKYRQASMGKLRRAHGYLTQTVDPTKLESSERRALERETFVTATHLAWSQEARNRIRLLPTRRGSTPLFPPKPKEEEDVEGDDGEGEGRGNQPPHDAQRSTGGPAGPDREGDQGADGQEDQENRGRHAQDRGS